MIKVIAVSGLLFLCNSTVMAGTIVEIQNKDELSSILTDGHLARLEMSGAEYAIVDYKKHSVKVVDPQKQQVMLLDLDDIAAGNDANAVRISINKLGTGKMVAGYKTQKFRYTANGKMCGVIYGSQTAYETQGMKELFAAVTVMMNKQYAALGGFARLVDACTLADMQVGNYVSTFGVPMRTEKNGRVESEIKSIKTGVEIPVETFVIPAAYKKVAMN
ncbi:MAG: hypothetical protein KAJ32_00270 [Gammaproteobacteria bacterium]|nr:hypothetical protein [Gammaproteobacteria bacterium]